MGPRRPSVLPRTAVAALALLAAGGADASDFFGPSQGLQLQPELDLIRGVGEAFRLVVKIEPTLIPSTAYGEMGLSLYGDWLVAPIAVPLLSPDVAKRRRLDVRLGVSWYPAIQAGATGWSDVLQLEGEATTRTTVPGQVLVTWRNRAEARWQVDAPTSFIWRLRTRLQVEREFDLSRTGTVGLTPFANAELMWTTAEDMWAQFRMEAGLQLGVDWFGKGQVIELRGAVITYLQPARSYSPVLGLVWYQYF